MTEEDRIMDSRPRLNVKRSLVYGIGLNDSNHTTSMEVEGKTINHTAYVSWCNMLKRCYSKKYHEKYPSYIGCAVCEEWICFSKFKEWWSVNYVKGWHLDKDLLVFGNKVYSPSTCIYLPPQLNELTIASNASRGEHPLGVHLEISSGRYCSQITVSGKRKFIGRFSSRLDAHRAWLKEKMRLLLNLKHLCDSVDVRVYSCLKRNIQLISDENEKRFNLLK